MECSNGTTMMKERISYDTNDIIIKCTIFRLLYSKYSGGAVYACHIRGQISYCQFLNCSSDSYGGAIDFNGISMLIKYSSGEKCVSGKFGQFASIRTIDKNKSSLTNCNIFDCGQDKNGNQFTLAHYGGEVDDFDINITNNWVYGTASAIMSDYAAYSIYIRVVAINNTSDDIVTFGFWGGFKALFRRCILKGNIQYDSRMGIVSLIDNTYCLFEKCLFSGNSNPLFAAYEGSIIIGKGCQIDVVSYTFRKPEFPV